MKFNTLTIVGVGLLGGSLGLALKKSGLARRIIGVGHKQSTLDMALKMNAVDECSLDLPAAVPDAEMVVFCTPVNLIADQAKTAARHCRAETLFTDVGSTKADIVHRLDGRLQNGVRFVGSHPLAGSEKRGVAFARPDLFTNRLAIVTPTERTNKEALQQTIDFWQAVGCRTKTMSPDDHDRSLALTSHLPHLMAAVLAGILPDELHDVTASGFRDTTRIAAGDPSLWTGIFQQNRSAVLDSLKVFQDRLQEFERALLSNDRTALDSLLAQAKKVRDALGSGNKDKGT